MTSFVKVVQNVLGQSVFSVKLAGQSDFVMQPDLSFNAGDAYTFDVSDPSMSGYSLVFGTEVDVASSIASTYTTVNGTTITLNIPSGYTGDALYYFDNTNAGMGYVTVFRLLESWQQLGLNISGEATGDNFGVSCALSSDGKTLAVGGHSHDSSRGHVRVYRYSNDAWVQLGSDIDGEGIGDKSGFSCSISADGNTIAFGGYGHDSNKGHVQVYEYNNIGNTWQQIGADIDGDTTGMAFGTKVSMNLDGTRIIIGDYKYDSYRGKCIIYAYDGTSWNQLGNGISGISTGDQFSAGAVSMSLDGNRIAIGANTGNRPELYGYAQMYQYNDINNTWVQLGSTIYGEENSDFAGWPVRISGDGTKVAVCSMRNDDQYTDGGKLRVFEYDSTSLDWVKVGNDLYGVAPGDNASGRNGTAISVDGYTVAVGAWLNDTNGNDSGHVRVFTIKEEVETLFVKVVQNVLGQLVFSVKLAGQAEFAMQPDLSFNTGGVYSFDQSDPSNAGHTLVITSAVDSSVNLINYQTLYGTPGQPGAYTTFVATSDTVSYVSYEVYVSVPSLPAPVGDVYEVASISADVDDDTKTGTTPALKRTFTRNAVTNMLNQYKTQLTGNKALKLAAGTKLPGFTIAPDKEITLRDARVTKTFTKDELANKTTYMVLNDSDPVTLKSAEDDTVTVTQSGTNFTVVTPAGTTNKVAGDTFEYDGLSLQFGSLVVNLSLIPPVDLALTAFDSAFVLTQQAVLPDVSYALDVSAEITLTQQISAADLSGVFFFKTDEDITSELVTDTSNVEYYLDRSQFTGGQATLNAMNGLVTTGYYGSNTTDHLGKDFLRDMAHQLFSTHFGVDLFTNEDAVITDISGKSAVIATDIFDKMGNVDKTNTALSGPDVSYGYYTTDTDSSNTNLTREILNQLLTLAPGRFTDKTTLRLDTAVPGVYGMPFVTNDTISYKLSVTAHASQNTTIATGKPGLGTRTYKVIFKVL